MACGTFAARRYGIDSNESRTIRACFLVVLGFFCRYTATSAPYLLMCSVAGLVRSRLPRLALASRAACFVGIWLLSRTSATLEVNAPSQFGHYI